jgi:hypothetical protein
MTPTRTRPTGRSRSRVAATAGSARIASGSRRSAWMNATRPPGAPAIRARAWTSTIGSLSTYSTRDDGAISWATSWTLPALGMPVPMSRNCRIPASRVR